MTTLDPTPATGNLPVRQSPTADLARLGALGFDVVSFEPEDLGEGCFHLMPLTTAQRLRAVPLSTDGARVRVAVADPSDLTVTDDLRIALSSYDVTVVVASSSNIDAALSRWSRILARTNEGKAIQDMGLDEEVVTVEEADDEGRMASLVFQLVDSAAEAGASDLHLEPTESGVQVRFRVDGVLQPHATYPRALASGLVNRLKVMGSMDVAERRLPQDGRFDRRTNGHTLDCRVVTLPTSWGVEGAVVRLLDQGQTARSLLSVGFQPEFVERLERALSVPHGIILVTGPTGSGKTTTLYAALGKVAMPERKTLSIEDPVEIRYPGITQVQVNERANLTFASALKSFLRADPDVILVGEIRDRETAALAAQAALTGHLVLSTLHTNEAVGAATRLSEMGLEGYVVASALRGVLSQRLLRRLCESCKEPYAPAKDELELLDWATMDVPEVLHRPVGCTSCNRTGYKGRLAVGEFVLVDDALAQAIIERRPSGELERIARESGTISLHDDALVRLVEGATTIEELRRVGV